MKITINNPEVLPFIGLNDLEMYKLLTYLAKEAYELSLCFEIYDIDYNQVKGKCIINSLSKKGMSLMDFQNDLLFKIKSYSKNDIDYVGLGFDIGYEKYPQDYRDIEYNKKNKRKWQ